MLLSSNDYLRLVASGLSKDVLPELTSAGSQSTAQIGIQALRELMKRNVVLPGITAEFTKPGHALLEQLGQLLEKAGEAPVAQVDQRMAGQDFGHLIARLDEGARRLMTARAKVSPALGEEISRWLRAVAEWELSYYSAFAAAALPEIAGTSESVQYLTREKLERHLRARLPERGALEVLDFTVVPGGFMNETFFFTLKTATHGTEQLVIRKNSSQPFFNFWCHRAREEFEIVKRVHAAGLPVPQPFWLFKDMPDTDSDYYVATRGMGRKIGSLSGASEAVPEALLFSLAKFLARLHGIPLKNFEDYMATGDTRVRLGDTVRDAVTKNVNDIERVWSSSTRLPSPGEVFILDWLKRNVPNNLNTPVVVHTDCFVHNFLVDGNEIETVLDWEAAHFGDPAEDLAYIKDQVSAHMPWERFLDHYRRCGGQPIDEASLDYYKCLLNFRNYFGTNIGVARIPNGYNDIRMIPLGSEFFTIFMRSCVEAARSR